MPTAEILFPLSLAFLIAAVPMTVAMPIGPQTVKAAWVARLCFGLAESLFLLALYEWLIDLNHLPLPQTATVWLVGITMSILAMVRCLRWVGDTENMTRQLLTPGQQPTPSLPVPLPFELPESALLVFLGSNVCGGEQMPHTIFQMGTRPVLTIDRRGKSPRRKDQLTISLLRLFDAGGKIVVRIDEGEFWVDPSLRFQRPDAHTLVVYDRADYEMLRIGFLNPKALSVTGVFRSPDTPSVIRVTPDDLWLGNSRITGSMFFGNGTDFAVG